MWDQLVHLYSSACTTEIAKGAAYSFGQSLEQQAFAALSSVFAVASASFLVLWRATLRGLQKLTAKSKALIHALAGGVPGGEVLRQAAEQFHDHLIAFVNDHTAPQITFESIGPLTKELSDLKAEAGRLGHTPIENAFVAYADAAMNLLNHLASPDTKRKSARTDRLFDDLKANAEALFLILGAERSYIDIIRASTAKTKLAAIAAAILSPLFGRTPKQYTFAD